MSALVLGVSHVPGVGHAVARRFALGGLKVGIMGRQIAKLEESKAAIISDVPGAQISCAAVDCTDADALKIAVQAFESEFGTPKCLVYNASARPFPPQEVAELSVDRLKEDHDVCVAGFLSAVQLVLPSFRAAGEGCILYTGATASLRGSKRFGSFASAKCAARALTQSLAKELAPEGVHVAHVVVDGMVDMPIIRGFTSADMPDDRLLDTTSIAETYWSLYQQDKRCWTFELDIRPSLAEW